MFRAHVLIVKRAKLYYTVSGIITLKQVSGLNLLNNNNNNNKNNNLVILDHSLFSV